LSAGDIIKNKSIYFFLGHQAIQSLGHNIDTTLNLLVSRDLVAGYGLMAETIDKTIFPYLVVSPTNLGVLLYCAAHNHFSDWRKFGRIDLGDFADVAEPKWRATSLKELVRLVRKAGPEPWIPWSGPDDPG
jgi:hypothetical protein